MIILILGFLAAVSASPSTGNKEMYKDQYSSTGHAGKHKGKHINYSSDYCTDPRTMRKHAAYTEWADAYSCTRHRCQPGGRNLAIYTVGCKRVEAPESAIECEEVVEDTNMQFPFCCTRLRCLVVVRGEVWTRVLGQPWEVLPAAPWSHMYKMKKPPPTDSTIHPKTNEQGPIYELTETDTETGGHEKVLRSGKTPVTDNPDCNEIVPRAAPPPPDIVIALSTNDEIKESSHKKDSLRRSQIKHENSRHKRVRKTTAPAAAQYFEEDREREYKRIEPEIQELEEPPSSTDKSTVIQHLKITGHPKVAPRTPMVLQLLHPVAFYQSPGQTAEGTQEILDAEGGTTPQEASEEKLDANAFADNQKPPHKADNLHHQVGWTEIPQNQWHEPHESIDLENRVGEQQQEVQPAEVQESKVPAIDNLLLSKDEKPANLQALVDAIGTRMRDIENVVQKMSEKVHQGKPGAEGSNEKRLSAEQDGSHKQHAKRPSTEAENYKRFSVRSNQVSKYLHSASDSTTEQPLFIGDTNLTGYFSDASNSVLRRNVPPKEPPPTYMAPVENRRKAPVHIAVASDILDDGEKRRKKHKKRRNKGSHSHKKHSHSKDDKRKHFNKLSSADIEKNVVSLEDSSGLANN